MGINLDRLKAYRKMHKLMQEEMAVTLGISKQSYHLKEKGKNDFTSGEVGVMANRFGIDPGELYKDSTKPLC